MNKGFILFSLLIEFIYMSKDKYYLIKKDSNSSLLRWNSNYCIEINESADFEPSIIVEINKLNQKDFPTPKKTSYQKVSTIACETYEDYYSKNLKSLLNIEIGEGDFYYKILIKIKTISIFIIII